MRPDRVILGYILLQNGPIPASFCLFLSFSHYNFNNTNHKKRRRCTWDLNLRPQDGRHRQYHRAMAAVLATFCLQNYPKHLMILGSVLKNWTFLVQLLWQLLGNFGENLVSFYTNTWSH